MKIQIYLFYYFNHNIINLRFEILLYLKVVFNLLMNKLFIRIRFQRQATTINIATEDILIYFVIERYHLIRYFTISYISSI